MSTNLTKPLRLRNDGGAQLQLERSSTVRSLTVNASGNVELDGTLVPNALTTATATITGGSINGTTVGATTPGSGAFTTLAASSTATLNILASSGATITGGSINGTPIGATTASTGAFTNLSATTITGPLTGNADTATKLSSVRTFALTGDVTGSVSSDLTAGASIASSIASGVVTNAMVATNAGIVDTKLATISTAGKVANSATTADSANTASAIVARDTNGNFTASTITAALTGNADTSTKLSSSRTFALTGDVTGSVSSDLTAGASIASTIANDAVTNAKVSPTAAIAYSKLALTGSIVDADIATAAAIADTKLGTIATAGKVSNSATTATASNTNSAIVARDGSGNFSAATITAALSGAVTSSSATITGGSINGTTIGATTASTGAFTTLSATGTVTGGKFAPTANTVSGNGMYLPTTNTLAFSTNGVERIQVTSGGSVGIGVTPNTTLEVAGNVHVSGGDRTIFNRSNNSLQLGTNNTARMTILAGGNVGIGKTSLAATLDVRGSLSVGNPANSVYFVLAEQLAKTASTTHTVTISIGSSAAQHACWVLELTFAAGVVGSPTQNGGRATYVFQSFTSVGDITEIEDIGKDVTFSATASGMDIIITATTVASCTQIGAVAKLIRSTSAIAAQVPTSIVLA